MIRVPVKPKLRRWARHQEVWCNAVAVEFLGPPAA